MIQCSEGFAQKSLSFNGLIVRIGHFLCKSDSGLEKSWPGRERDSARQAAKGAAVLTASGALVDRRQAIDDFHGFDAHAHDSLEQVDNVSW
jgi:hypothetical protein